MMALFAPMLVAGAESRSDAWITTTASSVLTLTERLSMSAVHVDGGQVTLYGTVRSQRDKAHAAEAIRGVEGVVQVRSLLQVVPVVRSSAARKKRDVLDAAVARSGAGQVRIPIEGVPSARLDSVDAEDDVIRRGVERALIDLDAKENADIQVLVKDGIVRLIGSVPTWQGNASRVYATRSVTGVRSIINSLRVVAVDVEAGR
jgi:osmotically-inducible protein OsmY